MEVQIRTEGNDGDRTKGEGAGGGGMGENSKQKGGNACNRHSWFYHCIRPKGLQEREW